MWWYEGDWGWGGWLIMMLGMLAFWALAILIYRRLSIQEEKAVAAEFGPAWDHYARRTPRFIPKLGPAAADEQPTDHEVPAGRR